MATPFSFPAEAAPAAAPPAAPASASTDNIWIAASDGDAARVDELLRSGVSVNAQDELGYSPIHAAVSYGHRELVELLLRAGANVSLRDGDGDTALHVCEEGEVAALLVAAGADTAAPNSEGQTPIDVARDEERVDMLRFYAQSAGLDMSFSFSSKDPAAAGAAAGAAAVAAAGGAGAAGAGAAGAAVAGAEPLEATASAQRQAEELRTEGNALFAAADYAAAVAKYSEALEANPRAHLALSNRSACHGQLGAWDDAAADAQQCMNLAPTFVKGYFRFATALLQLGGAMHAMIVCQQALQFSPGNADMTALLKQCEEGVEAARAEGGAGLVAGGS